MSGGLKLYETENANTLNERQDVFTLVESGARGPAGKDGAGTDELTQDQVEDDSSTVFGTVSGQRTWQAIRKWASSTSETFLGIVKGILFAYKEQGLQVSFVGGVASIDWGAASTANILELDSLTQNSTLNLTGTLTALKPITLVTVPDTGGPWTLDIVANGKTLNLTRNGSGTAEIETFELWSDGTDILTPDNGGLVWSKGA
jgi:hypothetical protein